MNKKKYKVLMVSIFLIAMVFNSFLVYAADELSVNAKSALLIEKKSGKVIYEKNINEQNYPASTTKILTAIITIENCDLDDVATVSQNAISNVPKAYVTAPLFVGEEIKVRDLLYALLLKSSNDAAYVLAEHVGGSIEGFSEMMNNKAKELGCENSHFVNPNGIDNPAHYTTAYDMYLISNYAMKNDVFAEIVSTYQYTLPATNKYLTNDRIMKNTNNFVNPSSVYYSENVKGIKTGTTDLAGNCLITEAINNGLEYFTVVFGAETTDAKFTETRKLIDYAFNNYILTELHKKDDVITNIEIENAAKENNILNLVIGDDIKVMKNINTNVDEIEPEIILNENIKAPISKGQEIGIVKYNVDGVEYTEKLLAANDVLSKTYYVETAIGIGTAIIVLLLIAVIGKKSKK